MLHRTASPLSVIGSTCTVKPRVKQSRHSRQHPPLHHHHHTSPPIPPGLGCHILVGAKWQVTLQCLRAFYWTNWPGITCQIQFNGTTVSCVLRVFQAPQTETWVAVESLLRKEPLTSSLTCFLEHRLHCTVHSTRSVMSGWGSSWMRGRGIITISYITDFVRNRLRLHKGRMNDIY